MYNWCIFLFYSGDNYFIMTTVVNIKHEIADVYIGRGSKWGNPFKIGKDGSRNDVINKYREYVMQNKDLMDSLNELKDKKLRMFL